MRRAGTDAALRLERLTGTGVRDCRGIGGQHGVRHYRAELTDGRAVFAKISGDAADGGDGPAGDPAGFEAEARGLGWLGEAGAVPVPEVVAWDAAALVISWVPEQAPGQQAAERFGQDLARLHTAGAETFGAPWAGSIAGLPLSNDAGTSWPEWYGTHRLLPYARRARDAGFLTAEDVRLIESVAARAASLAGPPEPPARIHGDCWSGNVLWSGGRGWLIDPAAHGGHRETDLAMLALFGAPYLSRVVSCYEETAPLAPGWRDRVPLHQLHSLLVHVCLFGPGYRAAALAAARAALDLAR
ncbi:MAG TPA: fructosamine kinase family protein [Streptosporangiaceae bacterium]